MTSWILFKDEGCSHEVTGIERKYLFSILMEGNADNDFQLRHFIATCWDTSCIKHENGYQEKKTGSPFVLKLSSIVFKRLRAINSYYKLFSQTFYNHMTFGSHRNLFLFIYQPFDARTAKTLSIWFGSMRHYIGIQIRLFSCRSIEHVSNLDIHHMSQSLVGQTYCPI